MWKVVSDSSPAMAALSCAISSPSLSIPRRSLLRSWITGNVSRSKGHGFRASLRYSSHSATTACTFDGVRNTCTGIQCRESGSQCTKRYSGSSTMLVTLCQQIKQLCSLTAMKCHWDSSESEPCRRGVTDHARLAWRPTRKCHGTIDGPLGRRWTKPRDWLSRAAKQQRSPSSMARGI